MQERRKAIWKEPVFYTRVALGVIFVAASFDKILNPKSFAEIIYNYQILPEQAINLTALMLPWIELIAGLMLIFGWWIQGATLLANLLLTTFFAALIYNLARGLDIHCGCFTTTIKGDPVQTWYVIRDAAFLTMGAFLLYRLLIKEARES